MRYILSFLFLIIILVLATGCLDFRMADKKLQDSFSADKIEMNISYYEYAGWRIRYLETGNPSQPVVLFIHGAPGALDAYERTLKDPPLVGRARMISVDRPGYGYSEFGRAEPSVKRQAEIIAHVLHVAGVREGVVVVGHSYGATIAVQMAIDYPEMVNGLVLVSATVDPDHEVIFFFNHWLEWKGLNWILPISLRVSNAEKVVHVEELTKMLPLWERVRARTVIIHGVKDRLAPIENATFAHKKLSNAPVDLRIYDDLNHLIPFGEEHRIITEAILDLLP
jgi:pimeloyl-ACP methyl ester carboxylesterase